MGMAATQVTLLQLTSRKNDIGFELEGLSLQKASLSRDMQKITRQYRDALNTKTLKWSNNAGATYVDLSYANLMRPGAANNNSPYLITNSGGKVILDNKYEQYAELFSSDGKPGGDYNAHRTEILSALIPGLTPDRIQGATESSAAVKAAVEKVETLQDEGYLLESEKKKYLHQDTTSQIFNRLGNINVNGTKVSISSTASLGNSSSAKTNLSNVIEQIKNGLKDKWLSAEQYKCFATACNDTYARLSQDIGDDDNENTKNRLETGINGISGNKDNYNLNIGTLMQIILAAYGAEAKKAENNVDCGIGQNNTGETTYTVTDLKNSGYINWESKYNDWKERMDTAKSELNAVIDEDNQSLTSTEETQIKFYDKLFNAIAEKGWAVDSQIEDSNYLNNMLQNNTYLITSIESNTDDDGNTTYEYSQDIASNFNNIFIVNDSDYIKEAEVAYAYEKNIINEKETRVDTRMKNLETEQSAINNMIKGLESVKNENIEKHMNVFA